MARELEWVTQNLKDGWRAHQGYIPETSFIVATVIETPSVDAGGCYTIIMHCANTDEGENTVSLGESTPASKKEAQRRFDEFVKLCVPQSLRSLV